MTQFGKRFIRLNYDLDDKGETVKTDADFKNDFQPQDINLNDASAFKELYTGFVHTGILRTVFNIFKEISELVRT